MKSLKYCIFIFIMIIIFFNIINCITIKGINGNNINIDKYKNVVCPSCGYVNAVYHNNEDRHQIVTIQCDRCERTIMVRL